MSLILRDGPVEPGEIEDLRATVGWDPCAGTYEKILRCTHAHYTARKEGRLVGFLRILSDGVANAYLIDLMVHPAFQRRGIGSELVWRAIRDMKEEGVQCVEVTFNADLECFYRRFPFSVYRAGVIDFDTMNTDEVRNPKPST